MSKKDGKTGEVKRIPLKGGGKPRGKVVRRKASSWSDYKTAAQVMEITRYVAKSSASGQKVVVSPVPANVQHPFACSPPGKRGTHIVTVPFWTDYQVPIDHYSKWRIYRKTTWHEGRHAADSPASLFLQHPVVAGVSTEATRQILNVIEDRRIEMRGVREHPGMREEIIYSDAYYIFMRPHMEAFYTGPMAPMAGTPEAIKAELLEAFLQRVLFGKVKGKMSDPAYRQWVEDAARRVEEEYEQLMDAPNKAPKVTDSLVDLTKEVAIMLHLNDYQEDLEDATKNAQKSREKGKKAPGKGEKTPEEKAQKALGDRWDEIVEEANKAMEDGDLDKVKELTKEVQDAVEEAEKKEQERKEQLTEDIKEQMEKAVDDYNKQPDKEQLKKDIQEAIEESMKEEQREKGEEGEPSDAPDFDKSEVQDAVDEAMDQLSEEDRETLEKMQQDVKDAIEEATKDLPPPPTPTGPPQPGEGKGEPRDLTDEEARDLVGEDEWDDLVERADKAINEGDLEKYEETMQEAQDAIDEGIKEKGDPREGEPGEPPTEGDFEEEGDPAEKDFNPDMTKLDKQHAEDIAEKSRADQIPMIDVDDTAKSQEPDSKMKKEAKKVMKEYFDQLEEEAEEEGRESREDKDGEPPDPDDVFADDVERARKGDVESRSEFSKISGSEIDDIEGLDEFPPIMEVNDTSPYKDMDFQRRMNEKLKEWQVGKAVEYRKKNGRLSVPKYIGTKGKVPFKKVQRRSVKGQKYLFVLDFSSSIGSDDERYKKALINAFTTLDKIGAKQAVFGFGGIPIMGKQVTGQFRVKGFEEGKFKPIHAGKVASIQNAGMTPLSPAYKGLEKYIKRHRPAYVITVTDGAPDSTERTKQMIAEIKKKNRSTKMVAFGLGPKTMEAQFKELGYDEYFTTEEIREIPNQLVDLIAPT